MLNFTGMSEAISTLGFPILISLILIKINNEQSGDHREEIREMRERYEKMSIEFRTELNQLHTSIDKNTIAVTKLIGKIDAIKTGGENNGKSN